MTLIPAVAPRTSATAPTAARSLRFISAVLLAHAGTQLARRLLVAERLDRIEACGLPRWIESEEDADRGCEREGQRDRLRRHHRPPVDEVGDRARAGETECDPDDAAQQRERDGLDEKLQENVAAGDRKSTRLNSSHLVISYAVFCLKKKKIEQTREN